MTRMHNIVPLAVLISTLTFVGWIGLTPSALQAKEHLTVFDERERSAIESIVTDYLIENPDLIVRALDVLQERQELAKAEQARLTLESRRDILERDPNSPVGGNPNGDVTVVEFFDYRCPYCKRVGPEVARLRDEDSNVRFVFKEWPILGPESVFAARAALAARNQDKYLEFHEVIMGQTKVTEASVFEAAADIGLDVEQLREDMGAAEVNAHIQETMELARALGITGTPAFIIGEQIVPGAVSFDQLRQFVELARAQTDENR